MAFIDDDEFIFPLRDKSIKKYLSEYYTNAIEQNFYNNLKPEVQSLRTQKLTQQNTNNISTKYYKPQQ